MRNWSEVPDDIIENVVQKLPSVEDVVQFGAVCKSWRFIATRENKPGLFNQFAPWLMLTKRENDNFTDDNGEGIRTVFSLSSKKLFHLRLPQAQGRRCWGTPYGWLFTIGLDLKINLLNPLTGSEISLPSYSKFQEQSNNLRSWKWRDGIIAPEKVLVGFIQNIALSSNPSSWTIPPTSNSNNCCLVMALHGSLNKLAFAAPGDEVWTNVESPSGSHNDLIFFKGQFYAVSTQGVLRICEINTTSSEAIDFAAAPDGVEDTDMFYLVEISGDLHLVARIFVADGSASVVDFHYDSTNFELFKFDFDKKKWLEVYELGDHALFVGNNTSFAISTTIYPEFKSNCIYFTDDHYAFYDNRFCDMGVFDYETQSVERFYCCDDVVSKFSRPLFFLPSL